MSTPLRIGSPEAFEAVRTYLRDAGYSEERVCTALGLSRLTEFTSAANSSTEDTLVALFLLGREIPAAELQSAVPDAALAAMNELGLLELRNGSVHATTALYPSGGLWIASDRVFHPDRTVNAPSGDFVFLTITPNTQHFLDFLPDTDCESFLDLGCGAGVAALQQAKHSRETWATDITHRSCDFTRFNAALNDIGGLHVEQGDLYAPVGQRRFARIGAHLPFYPSMANLGVYVDGGADGEALTRRTVSGLPERLAPGGRLYALTMVSDRDDGPAEERVRSWLGLDNEEFDVTLAVRTVTDPGQFAFDAVDQSGGGLEDARRFARRLHDLGINEFVYTHMVIERHAAFRDPQTSRRMLHRETTSADLEWLLAWEGSPLDFSLRPRLAPTAELTVRHAVQQGELIPVAYEFSANYPFLTDLECKGWIANLANMARGDRTIAELFELTHRETGIPQPQFAAAMHALISAGVLTVR